MSVQVKQLKDKGTGTPFVPITHWDAVGGKPDIATTSALTNGLSTKQDVLTAGANIEIDSSNTISVTGIVVPEPSYLDIKDLADSTGLREEWSGKQDALTAGANIEIDSAGTISVTGVTSTTEEELEDMSFVISNNINELDDRLIAVESGKQDALTAGDNIEIDSAGTISVTGVTVPVVTDFDIKDLTDSTGLRAEWSGKQNSSDNNLNTTDKTLVGAINELLARIEALETQLNNQA